MSREYEIARRAGIPISYVNMEDFYKFRKEMQERMAIVEEKDKFWKERLTYIALLVASWTFILTKFLI